jgi:hypothetical protein
MHGPRLYSSRLRASERQLFLSPTLGSGGDERSRGIRTRGRPEGDTRSRRSRPSLPAADHHL